MTSREAIIKLANDAGFYADDLAIKVFPHQYHSVSNTDIEESLKQFYNAAQADQAERVKELEIILRDRDSELEIEYANTAKLREALEEANKWMHPRHINTDVEYLNAKDKVKEALAKDKQ